MRDESICAPSVRSSDGIHFKMQGYRNMWAKAAAASGYQVASTGPVAPPAVQPAQNVAAPRETPRVRTTVAAATLTPISSPQLVVSQFALDFRWKESDRFTGRFVPAD
jgi:hypothetical protein